MKSQLEYSGMQVKELAALSGLKKRTIDSYLGNQAYIPSVLAALNIAQALGVSVEYLVTGKEASGNTPVSSLPEDIKEIVITARQLNARDRGILLKLARLMKDSNHPLTQQS